MSATRVTVTTTLDEPAGEVRLAARCTCGVRVERVADARDLYGRRASQWRGDDARAITLRTLARVLEADGCVHAWHDARMVTPCLFRPTRTRCDEALDDARDLAAVTGAEAWETLAARERIPMAWVGDDARRFVVDPDALDVAPASPDDALAFATDVDGVARAEDLARELLSRMRAFGLPQPPRVAWRVVDPAFWTPRRGWHLTAALPAARASAVGVATPDDASPPWWSLARFDVSWADAWSRAPDGLPNAMEPLAAIWMLGYALDAVTDDVAVLVAPRLAPHGLSPR